MSRGYEVELPWSAESIARNGIPFALAALDKNIRRLENGIQANRSEDMTYPKWERQSFARLESKWQHEVLKLIKIRKELGHLVPRAKAKTISLIGYTKPISSSKKKFQFPPTKIVNKKFKGFPPTKIVENYGSPSAIAARRAEAQAKLANRKAYALAAGARKEAAKAKLLENQVNAWRKRTFKSDKRFNK